MGRILGIAAAIATVLGIAWWVGRDHESKLNTAEGQKEAGNPLFDPANYPRNETSPTPDKKAPDHTSIVVGQGGKANVDQVQEQTDAQAKYNETGVLS